MIDHALIATVRGAESTSAHDTVCQAPSSRASIPPSAYPTAAATTAPKSSASAQDTWPNPPYCIDAKATAAMPPMAAKPQNAGAGRSPVRSTTATAVAAGSSPITTAPWLAGAVVNANDVSSGNPRTTPAATTARRDHCLERGHGCLAATNVSAARTDAIAARPTPMSTGSSP